MKPTYRKSWAGNLLMWSGLALGPSFKVNWWFTGFGQLSFRWLQIYIGYWMRRSCFHIRLSLSLALSPSQIICVTVCWVFFLIF